MAKIDLMKSDGDTIGAKIVNDDKTIIISRQYQDYNLFLDIFYHDGGESVSLEIHSDDLYVALMLIDNEEGTRLEKEMGLNDGDS